MLLDVRTSDKEAEGNAGRALTRLDFEREVASPKLARLEQGQAHIRADARVAAFYLARADAIYVLHAFEKKTQKTSANDLRTGRERFRAVAKLRQQHGKEKRG